jgi:hemolysin D
MAASGACNLKMRKAESMSSPQPNVPAPVKPAPAQLPAASAVTGRDDQEFLPAALEILETPPSPGRVWMIWFICAFFTAALIWSYFGKIEIHAVAQGRMQPSGRSKVVQPLEPGRVRAIAVENGSRVKAGDLLLELDPTETAADREANARDLDAVEAEVLRRRAAIAVANSGDLKKPPGIEFGTITDKSVQSREQAVLAADLSQLASSRDTLNGQLNERLAQKEHYNLSLNARARLIAVLKERHDMRKTLVDKAAGTKTALYDAAEVLERAMTEQAAERGQLLESEAGAESIRRKLDETKTQFLADQTQKLAEAEKKRERIAQDLVKSRSKEDRTKLFAPIDGSIQQLTVTTVGQVVASGQSLMTIVPTGGPIEIEALVENRDIGFVSPDQDVAIKIESFPFTRYGTVPGKLIKVSRDAVDARDAQGSTDASNVAKAQSSIGALSATPKSQNLVFPVTIKPLRDTINIDGREVPLAAGMAVTVEVRTGERRVLDYLLSPFREATSQAAHER